MILINVETNKEVKVGDILITFRDIEATVISWSEPKTCNSSGRLYTTLGEHFPSVYNCKFVKQ